MTSKNGGVYEPLLATDADIENNDNKNSKNALSLEDAATSFSRTFLNYLSPLFDLGMKRELELVDLGSPSEQDKCEALYERFNTQWEEEVKNKKGDLKRLSLWNPLWSMVGRFYAFQCIFLYYIYAIFSYGPVLILSQLVNHLQGTTTLSTAYLWTYVSLMFVFPIISSLSMNQSNIIIAHISVQFRNALVMKIYRKALSLSPASRQKHSTGQIINMFANDTKQIQGFLFFYNNLYCAPAQIILTLYLIYLQVGVSTFAGLGYMLITSPLIGVILSMLNATRKLKSKETDKRVKFMNEILAGIRVIKYYAWEAAFKEKVEAIRFQELKYIKRIQYVFAVAFSLLFLATPIMLPVLVFFVFIKLGNELDSATAFTTIALFGLLQMPLLFLPIALVNYSQACVSMDRIKAFLVCTELDQYVQTHAVHQPRVENNDGSDLKKPVDKFADAPIVVQLRSVSACWTLPGEESETDPKSGTKKPKKDDVDIIRPLMKTIAQPSKGSFSLKPFSRRTISENISTRTAPTQRSWGLRWMGDRPPEKNPSVSASIPEDGENEEEDESASAVRSLLGATSMKSSSQQLIVTGSTKTLSDINITIKQGQLVAIVGTVGSGKSSLLNLLLGEMHLTSGSVSMRGSVAYCDQKPWIRNCTVQENILFDTPMDEDRFQAALEASSLIDDIKILPGGVHTEIGERGINLSGGQKARVALARAVYQDADCYVLDDPLSAVDAHVGQHIFEKCLCGALVKKTRLLVTHSVHLLPQCDVIIIMEGGAVKAWGSYDDLRNSGFDISAFVPSGSTANTITDVETSTEGDEALSEPSEQNPSEDEMKDSHVDRNTWQSVDAADPTSHTRTKGNNTPKGTPKSAHKTVDKDGIDASDKEAAPTLAPQSTQLIKDEEKGVGAVDLSIYKYYLKFAGAFNVTVIIVCLFMQQVCTVLASFYLSYWGTRSVEREEDGNEMSGNTNLQYLFVYSLLCVGGVVFLMFRSVSLAQMSNLASIKIHTALLNRVLAAPVAFFDVTPLGRIVNRFSSDLATIDESLMQSWSQVLQNILGILAAVVSIAIATNGIFIILLVCYFISFISFYLCC